MTTEITASELYYGAAHSHAPLENKKQVDAFLKTLRVLLIGKNGAQFFGAFKAQLRREGMLIPDADLWIGSISRALRVTVVTGNTRHLSRIPKVTLTNWIRD